MTHCGHPECRDLPECNACKAKSRKSSFDADDLPCAHCEQARAAGKPCVGCPEQQLPACPDCGCDDGHRMQCPRLPAQQVPKPTHCPHGTYLRDDVCMSCSPGDDREAQRLHALKPARGAILTRAESDAMEMRVMSIGCTDRDFRALMDSHESLRNIVAYYTQRTQTGAPDA